MPYISLRPSANCRHRTYHSIHRFQCSYPRQMSRRCCHKWQICTILDSQQGVLGKRLKNETVIKNTYTQFRLISKSNISHRWILSSLNLRNKWNPQVCSRSEMMSGRIFGRRHLQRSIQSIMQWNVARTEAIIAAKTLKIFSGYQSCKLVTIIDVSGTILFHHHTRKRREFWTNWHGR
jgi:hypothetical protein